jgi:hypothetical protein
MFGLGKFAVYRLTRGNDFHRISGISMPVDYTGDIGPPIVEDPAAAKPPTLAHRSVSGLLVLAASDFELRSAQVPQNAHGMVEEMLSYKGTSGQVKVEVLKITFKPGVPFNIDDYIEGHMDGMALGKDVIDFHYSTVPTLVGDRAAVRAFAQFSRWGVNQKAEGLFITAGQTIWILGTTFLDAPDQEAIANSILESIRFPE